MKTDGHPLPAARALLLTSALILVLLLPGCGGKPAPTALPAALTPLASLAAQPSSQPPTAAAQPASTAAPKPSPAAGATAGKFADPSELNSYRMKLTTWEQGDDKSKGSVIVTEWVKNPPASRIVMGTVEVITIGDTSWTKVGDKWVQQASTPKQDTSISDELMRQLEGKSSYQEKGRETINGIPCKRYAYTGEMTISSLGNMKGEGTARGQGDMWVADQAGLPAVVIRNIGTSDLKMKVSIEPGATAREVDLAMNSEMELYDINQPITIKAPEGAITVPGGSRTPAPTAQPTQPRPSATPTATGAAATRVATATATARPAQASATPPPTAAVGQVLFADDFTGDALDAKWAWEDPGDDSIFDLQAVPGSLRLTAMTGNDLAPWNNYDAPRLLTQVGGDFILETRVGFDPQEDYQGAGLLVWLDSDNFLRLERGYGGLSGREGAICFLKQEWGSLALAADAAPTSAAVVELRLQRKGQLWTAWWRDPAGAWQQIGSTELSAGPDVQAGIALVVDWGASEINADFDYVRISRPK